MKSQEKFSLLRSILRTLGLSAEAVDDIIERIVDFLSERDEKPADQLEYPYFVRDDFLSPAEQSFYLVLKSIVSDWALICPKGPSVICSTRSPMTQATIGLSPIRLTASMLTFFYATRKQYGLCWASNWTTRVIREAIDGPEMNSSRWFSRRRNFHWSEFGLGNHIRLWSWVRFCASISARITSKHQASRLSPKSKALLPVVRNAAVRWC